MNTPDTLEEMSLFQGLLAAELAVLAENAVWKRYRAGEFVFCQGDAATHFHVLHTGVVKLFRSTAEGKEQTVYLVEEGEPFCLCALYGASSMPLGALTMSPCSIVSFQGDVVGSVLQKSSQVLMNILRVLNSRLMHSFRMIEDLALRTIQQRTASFLVHTLRVSGKQGRITLSVSRQEVAKILGTTPETISRVLARMTQDRLIEARGRNIVILDLDGLAITAGELLPMAAARDVR